MQADIKKEKSLFNWTQADQYTKLKSGSNNDKLRAEKHTKIP